MCKSETVYSGVWLARHLQWYSDSTAIPRTFVVSVESDEL